MKSGQFKNKNILIIGGSSGIGEAIAKKIYEENGSVYIISRSLDKLEKLYRALMAKNSTNKVSYFAEDIQNLNKIFSIIDKLNEQSINIDILINSAGIYPKIDLLSTKEEDWDQIMNVNLKSVFFICRKIALGMIKNRGGNIINIGSFAAQIPSVGTGIYATSKAGLNMITRAMAAEWAPHNIRVNGVNPGVIKTNLTKEVIKKYGKILLEDIALNRFGKADEVAEAVLFLASDASSYITGEVINITGGKLIAQNSKIAWDKISG